ncbi:hypothetical protein GCM10010124_28020 [Pilimelia terevasa]|uniref:TOMM leader peptide-binding protein n=1 Tax=Pilimelia terevasa TaxID=53372 RepID=A0A8J3BPH6_9ACTN|nr:hypothetical protein GCM10010124_28020 [Pilimelia terevasa]
MGATDVACAPAARGQVELRVGAARYVLRMAPEQVGPLRDVVAALVPRLRRSRPIDAQLKPAEVARIRPYVTQLVKLGVLLTPAPGTAPVESEGDRRLYTFLARRVARPDPLFTSVKARPVALRGPAALTGPAAEALAAQGLTVAPAAGPGDDTALTVVFETGGPAGLRAANKGYCAAGAAWVPVLVDPRRVRLGPWIMPGQTACLRCLPADPHRPPEDAAGDGRPAPAPGAAPGDGGPVGVADTWLTLQPGCVRWLAGLLSHLAFRTYVPMGDSHPWGRATTLDALTGEQASVAYWRDPYCPDCAPAGAVTDAWVPA